VLLDVSIEESENDVWWVLSRLWNTGVELFARQEHKGAFELCSSAMELLERLSPTSKAALAPKMVSFQLFSHLHLI
jgi:hypothetical protein